LPRLPHSLLLLSATLLATSASAGEFGYLQSAETLPEGALEVIQSVTRRADKGYGDYEAYDFLTKLEYGVTDKFTIEGGLRAQSIDTSGLLIDGYMPGDEKYSAQFSGFEIEAKYKFLNTAEHDLGLSSYWGLNYSSKDPHSGQDKRTVSLETGLLAQKYFLEGQMVWLGNIGLEATHATRDEIQGLPEGFEWPTDPEVELEFKVGTGLSYRIVQNWYIAAEVIYEEEHETEVGKERYSLFAGPSIHYSSKKWWMTLSYLEQINGGGEKFDEQDDSNLHLIEKTKDEVRLKFGLNF